MAERDIERTVTTADAQERILARIHRLPTEFVPLVASPGRALGAEVIAPTPVPPFTNSAMDGYAVRAVDTWDATPDAPVSLRVVATVAAGDAATHGVSVGEAVRIMTGAALPQGADAVVAVEETDRGIAVVAIRMVARPGLHIRGAGEELAAGTVALTQGARITAGAVGLLATLGLDTVPVTRRPRIAVLSTGNEVVASGTAPGAGQIMDANGPLLIALVTQFGGEAVPLGVVRDDPDAVAEAILTAGNIDFVIMSGGASVGLFDVVRPFLAAHGEVDFTRVRMRPGQPCAFGVVGGVPVLALPGNPGAAFVTFHLLARPAIVRFLGLTPEIPPLVPARLRYRLHTRGGRDTYVRARLYATATGWEADTAVSQNVGSLPALAVTDALVRIPAHATELPANAPVEALLLNEW